jgi:hypothetical protein
MNRALLWSLLAAAGLATWSAPGRVRLPQAQQVAGGGVSAAAWKSRDCLQGVTVRRDTFDADGDSRSDNVEVRKTSFRYRYLARWVPRPGSPGSPETATWAVANHLLVHFKPGTSRSQARESLQASLNLTAFEVRELPLPGLFLVQTPWQPAEISDKRAPGYLLLAASRLRGKDKVLRISPDYLYFSLASPMQDPGPLQDDLARIGALRAWKTSKGSREVRVAVLDTGVDLGHPDLIHNIARRPNGQVIGWDFHNKDRDPSDDNSHGTWCAGIIGAEGGDGNGLAGVNWYVSILPIKFLDSDGCGTTADAVSGILFAVANGASVISSSWGSTPYSPELDLAVRFAGLRRVLFVAGAGNDPRDLDKAPFYPASLNLPNVISVGGVDNGDNPVPDWGRGSRRVHLSAPGMGVVSTAPRPVGVEGASGTSASTAFISGACALVQAATGLKYLDVRHRLLESSKPISGTGSSCSQGRIDLANALRPQRLRKVSCP